MHTKHGHAQKVKLQGEKWWGLVRKQEGESAGEGCVKTGRQEGE